MTADVSKYSGTCSSVATPAALKKSGATIAPRL
jgi:hypothetical protein